MLNRNSIFQKIFLQFIFFSSVFIFISKHSYCQYNKTLTIVNIAELTLENNKNIQVSKIEIEISEGDILKAKSNFNLKFEADVDKTYSIRPLTFDYREKLYSNSNTSYIESNLFDYSINGHKRLKFGTTINPGISFTNFGKDSLYSYLYNNGYGEKITNRSNVFLNINQPILKGFGKKYNTTNLRISKKRFSLAEEYYYSNISKSLLESFILYTECIGAKKELEIQQEIDKKLLLIINQIEKLVELDVIPASDINYLMANYKTRRSELVDAQNQLENSKLILANRIGIINKKLFKTYDLPDEFIISSIDLVQRKDDYIDYSFGQSLKRRKDYISSGLMIEINEELVQFYNKSLKPTLDLKLSIGYNGIYESGSFDQFYMPYIENIAGINYKVGFSFTIDTRNDFNMGNLIEAKGNLQKQETIKKSIEEDIYTNISKSYNDISNYNNKVLLYKEIEKFYEKALEDENTKLKLGTSTIINLIQIQNDYIVVLDQLSSSILDLNISILNYRFQTGTLFYVSDDNTINIDFDNLFLLPFIYDNY